MTMSLSVVVVFLLVSVAINVGSATTLSQTDPSYVPVCPGDTVIFTCTTNNGILYWSLNKITAYSFTSSSSNIGSTSQLLDPFTLTLTNKSGPSNQTLESTATVVNVSYSLNGMNIYCTNDIFNINTMSTLTVTDTTLPPIGLLVTALNDSSVNLTWSPPSLDSICITGYIISRDDIPVTTTSTNTLVLSHGLSYGNTYNFTVAVVDKTNTTGSYSQHVIINLSVPNVVRNLNYTSTGDGTITVYWNSPVNNYHPDIIHYIIYTNMTDTSHVTITSDITNYTLSVVSGGSTYFISVSAVNIIGEGTNNTIYVSLVDVSPTPPSSIYRYSTVSSALITDSTISSNDVTGFIVTDSTSSASIQFTSAIISSFDRSSTITTVTPIVCDSSSAAISVGIGVPISVLLSSIVSGVITGCIVYFIMKNRRGSTDVKGQHNPVVIYDVPDVQRDIELQTNTAYGHVNL